MAVQKRYRRRPIRSLKRRTTTLRRRVGAFGLYRGTRNVGRLRSVARAYGPTRLNTRTLNPFPNCKLVRHKYCDVRTLPAVASPGLYTSYTFRTNSMYDPDWTAATGDHQPMFHDEMLYQYKYYTVLHSKIIIKIPAVNDATQNILLFCDDDSTVPADPNTCHEQHGTRVMAIKADRRNGPIVLTASWNAAKWMKTTKAGILADDTFRTAAGGNPSASAIKFYHLYASSMNPGSEALASQRFYVEMVFYTLWREPKDHVGS